MSALPPLPPASLNVVQVQPDASALGIRIDRPAYHYDENGEVIRAVVDWDELGNPIYGPPQVFTDSDWPTLQIADLPPEMQLVAQSLVTYIANLYGVPVPQL